MADNTKPHTKIPGAPTSLLDLDHYLLTMIVDYLSAQDATTVGLVNTTLHHAAEYSGHRNLKLDITQEGYGKTRVHLAMMERDELFPAVRCIEVVDNGKSAEKKEEKRSSPLFDFLPRKSEVKPLTKVTYDDRVERICSLIPSMTGLREVHWRAGRIPDLAIKTLRAKPEVKLFANNEERSWHRHSGDNDTPNIFFSLQGNHNLHSLEVSHCYTNIQGCLAVTRPLKDLLLSCPNLRALKLNLFMPKSGCVVHCLPFNHEPIGCIFSNGEKLPPLKHLDIVEYQFNGQEDVAYWIENFDWSRLQTLRCPTHFGLALMPKLTALKDITFYDVRDDEHTSRFYMEVPSKLEAISVKSLRNITIDGIIRHGSGLRKLTLHQLEGWRMDWAASAVDDISLVLIHDNCPNIEELDLDIARDGEWPYSTLGLLASFPRLHTLTIRFELGIGDGKPLVQPLVTFSKADMLFRYLHSRNPRIKKVTIHSGSPAPIGLGLPSPMAFWPERNSTSFPCALSERDDEAAEGKFKVTCSKVNEEVNEVMRQMVQAEKQEEQEDIKAKYQKKHDKDVKKSTDRPGGFSRLADYYQTFPIAWEGPIERERWASMGAMY